MNKQFIYIAAILAVAMAATFSAAAQETDATANDTLNSTSLNNITLDNATVGAANQTEQKSHPANSSAAATVNIGAAIQAAENLSTVNGHPKVVAPISEMAGIAPLVAAGASSAQVASEPAGSFKIGAGVGGIDPFNPAHLEIESLKLGLPIKPMRDTGKMFFVCDIV